MIAYDIMWCPAYVWSHWSDLCDEGWLLVVEKVKHSLTKPQLDFVLRWWSRWCYTIWCWIPHLSVELVTLLVTCLNLVLVTLLVLVLRQRFDAAGASTSLFETNTFGEMAFSIDRQSVVAKTRALKAEYTSELAQDLKAVHGLDALKQNWLTFSRLKSLLKSTVKLSAFNLSCAKLGCQQRDLFFKSAGATVPIAGDTLNGGGVTMFNSTPMVVGVLKSSVV